MGLATFHCEGTCGEARAGVLQTRRGAVLTPAFMPVGTQASVKALTPVEVENTGARMVIMNTYHLWLRPGPEVVREQGGLHEFSQWPHAIVTDSGGYQAYSLAQRTRLTDDGFIFASHLDGERLQLSPEESMRVQSLLGSDIAMQLDVCPPAGANHDELERAVGLTTDWARRCLEARQEGQALFGIVQGGLDNRLRSEHAAALAKLPLDGLALGGFSVGEPRDAMHRTLRAVAPALDPARVRYLMGVGTPADIVRAVGSGVDLFDCVLPTRNARNGQVFVSDGKLMIRNHRHRTDSGPLEAGCTCPTCSGGFSRAYLRHLYLAGEILAHRLLTLHNLHFFQQLVAEARQAVLGGTYPTWSRARLSRLAQPDEGE
jgi:queuine tRNA-ribosyltransferase